MKKRKTISQGAEKPEDKRPELVSKLPKKDYVTFKDAVGRLCDDTLKIKTLTPDQKTKVAWLRSRIIIEL